MKGLTQAQCVQMASVASASQRRSTAGRGAANVASQVHSAKPWQRWLWQTNFGPATASPAAQEHARPCELVNVILASVPFLVCFTLLAITSTRLFKFRRNPLKVLLITRLILSTSSAAVELGMSPARLQQAWQELLSAGWAHFLLSSFIITGVWALIGYFARERELFRRAQVL